MITTLGLAINARVMAFAMGRQQGVTHESMTPPARRGSDRCRYTRLHGQPLTGAAMIQPQAA
jgi:hypothetical protein